MFLIDELLAKPAKPAGAAGIFTMVSGVLYLSNGLVMLLWPGIAQALFASRPFVGQEEGLGRIIGMNLAIIGWLYIFGARGGNRPFVAATILDRLVLVPVVLFPLAIAGIFPHLVLVFAILDPILALTAWALLRRTRNDL